MIFWGWKGGSEMKNSAKRKVDDINIEDQLLDIIKHNRF